MAGTWTGSNALSAFTLIMTEYKTWSLSSPGPLPYTGTYADGNLTVNYLGARDFGTYKIDGQNLLFTGKAEFYLGGTHTLTKTSE